MKESLSMSVSEKLAVPRNGMAVLFAMFFALLPEVAFAAGNGSAMFCFIADYFRQIVGAAILLALLMWAINHVFGGAKLGEMVVSVGVAAGVVIIGATFITSSGLTLSC